MNAGTWEAADTPNQLHLTSAHRPLDKSAQKQQGPQARLGTSLVPYYDVEKRSHENHSA